MIKPFTPEELKSMRIWDAAIDRGESNERTEAKRVWRQKKKARAATQADAKGTANIITNEMEESKNEV